MKKLIGRGIGVTLFMFLTMWGFSGITKLNLFTAFDPISQALGEFELTDIVFSNLRPMPLPDDRIVLVNLGPSRRAIAQQIALISQQKPKVIGIDGFFNCEGGLYDTINCPNLLDTLGNLMLGSAIQEAGNVVLVTRLLPTDSTSKTGAIDVFDSIEYSDPIFSDHAQNAFANLATGATYQEDVKICKSFFPRIQVKGKDELAFAVKLCMAYDSLKTMKFLQRGKEEEIISFRGNFEIPDVKIKSLRENMAQTSNFRVLCYAIDWEDLLTGNYDSALFKDKIVIMGSLGAYFGDPSWEDKFFTPLNTKIAGRANPDMFGLVVHANIAAMILNGDFIYEIPEWLQVGIACLACILNVFLLSWVDRRLPVWFDGLSVIIQVVEIILVSALVVQVFSLFNYKLDLTLTLAVLALVGPCFDLYKSFENTVILKYFASKEGNGP